MSVDRHRASRAVWLSLAAAVFPWMQTAAQGRLVGYRSSSLGAVYEHWSFTDGISQPTRTGDEIVLIDHASQLSIPVAVRVPLGENWTIDVSSAYSTGRVVLSSPDPELNTTEYRLNGITDVRLRAIGRLTPSISLTVGLTAPTGKTSLGAEEVSALRVLAAPPLGLQIPRLGNGFSVTGGVVLSRQLGESWAGALGVSYEARGTYDPGALIASLSNPEISPSDALRVSLGLDGLVGQNGMTLGLSADFYPNQDQIVDPALPAGTSLTTQLGPVLTADWQFRLGTSGFRELTLYAVDRYRTKYRSGSSVIGTEPVAESSGNYLDAGIRSVIALGEATGILAAGNFRHQTGLRSDNTLATAGMVSGTLTLGLLRDLGSGYTVQPFMRGQVGRINSAGQSSSAIGYGGGVTVGLRF
jgi:hypothetical protein